MCSRIRLARNLADFNFTNRASRAEKAEIAGWLGVWLQQPELFPDWLDLRRRSEDYRRRFAGRE